MSKFKKAILTDNKPVTCQQEKDILWAKEQLNKSLDFATWKSKYNPSQFYIDLYLEILEDLKLIASGEKRVVRGLKIENIKGVQTIQYL